MMIPRRKIETDPAEPRYIPERGAGYVFGVPVESKSLSGVDSLYSIVQMPAGIPVGTLAIGKAGAKNAAILAAQILARKDSALAERLRRQKKEMAAGVEETSREVEAG